MVAPDVYGQTCDHEDNSAARQSCATEDCPVDCVGEWGPWSDCSASCGANGTAWRLFNVSVTATGGGSSCTAASSELDERSCNTDADCPVDCVGSWGEWGSCSEICNGGNRNRSLLISQPAMFGGSSCVESQVQLGECNTNPCADCDGSWSSWSACEVSCGGGSKSRLFTITTQAEGSGLGCNVSHNHTVAVSCNTEDCPVDCVGEWGPWSDCSASCGANGTAWRLFNVSVTATGGGSSCTAASSELDERSCNTDADCPVDCVGSWGEWGSCSEICNGGNRNRSLLISQPAMFGGSSCVESQVQLGECNTNPCADCDGSWSSWSACEVSCGGGSKSRLFTITTQAEGSGLGCNVSHNHTVAVSCNTEDCPVDCVGEWGPWSDCSASCGANGTAWRLFNVSVTATGGGSSCTAASSELDERSCNTDADCPVDCVGSWGEWGSCSEICNGGNRNRSLLISQPAMFGGSSCVESQVQLGECNTNPCADCDGSWSSWSACEVSCGGGSKSRLFTITTQAEGSGLGCNVSHNHTVAVSCNTEDCPVDCVGEWGPWSDCSASCGANGTAWRLFNVSVTATGGGSSCTAASSELDERSCNTDADCPVDCVGSWGEWGSCSEICNGGNRNRSLLISQPAMFGGSSCVESQVQLGECNTNPCADCDGSWSSWSACEVSCGGGSKSRLFTITTQAEGSGLGCNVSHNHTVAVSCNTEDCPVDCVGEWGPWSDCSASCGANGTAWRLFNVSVTATGGGSSCTAASSELDERSCNTDADCPVDCVGSWGEWGSCSEICNGGNRNRSLLISQPAMFGGSSCVESQVQLGECNTNPCADCDGSWSSWSACEVSCGGGSKSRLFTITTQAEGSGLGCNVSHNHTVAVSCNTEDCPVDCVGEWGPWSDCSASCGANGTAWRLFNVSVTATGGGSSCTAASSELDERSCNTDADCPVDCVGSWGEWGSCSEICNGGNRNRSLLISQPAMFGGSSCVESQVQLGECNTNPCADCDGSWSSWSACEVSCGGGSKSRLFTITTQAEGSGLGCNVSHNHTVAVSCNTEDCPVDCVGEWGPWSDCSASCGANGTAWRLFNVSVTATGGGSSCTAASSELDERSCNTDADCPVDCVGSWGEWGSCSEICNGGNRNRSLLISQPAMFGGSSCVESQVQLGECNTNPCADCDGSWSSWSACEVSCGGGSKSRLFTITTQAEGSGLGCNVSHNHTVAVSCNTEDCPVDCVGEWGPWSDCSASCGANGTAWRLFNVSVMATTGGRSCIANNGKRDDFFCWNDNLCPGYESTVAPIAATTISTQRPNGTLSTHDALRFLYSSIALSGLGTGVFKRVRTDSINRERRRLLATDSEIDLTYMRRRTALPVSARFQSIVSSDVVLAVERISPKALFAVVRTTTVASETKVLAVKVWGDYGGQSIASSDVSLTVENDALVQTYVCSQKLKTFDGFTCSITIATEFFRSEQSVASVVARVEQTRVFAAPAFFQLEAAAVYPNHDTKMFLQLPSNRVLAGARIATHLFANTTLPSGLHYELSVWAATVHFGSYAQVVSVESDLYDIAFATTVNENDVGSLSMVATFKASVENNTSSSRLRVGTIIFELMDSLQDEPFSIIIDSMVSSAGNRVAKNEHGLIAHQSTFQQSDTLQVAAAPAVVGLQAYVDGNQFDAEVLNTFPIGGNPAHVNVSVLNILSCHTDSAGDCIETASSTEVSDAICSSENTAIAQCLENRIFFSGEETRGGEVNVTVRFGNYSRFVVIKVWLPTNLSLTVADNTLNMIQSACSESRFQSTTAVLVGTLVGGVHDIVRDVDFTAVATITSSAPALEIDASGIVSVKNALEEEVIVTAGNISTSVFVSTGLVSVTGMAAFVFNQLELSSVLVNSGNDFTSTGNSVLAPNLGHRLHREGASSPVFGVVVFDDGQLHTISDSELVIASMDESEVSTSTTNKVPHVVVETGASSFSGTELVHAKWELCNSTQASSFAFVNISLPQPLELQMQLSENDIVDANDALAAAPIEFATTSTIKLTLVFADGSQQDFSNDSRVTWSCSSARVKITGNTLSVQTPAIDVETVVVTASLGQFSNLYATAEVTVDVFDRLEVVPFAFPSCQLVGCTNKTRASPIQRGSGAYQRLQLSATAFGRSGFSKTLDWSSNSLSIIVGEGAILQVDGLEAIENVMVPVVSLAQVLLIPASPGLCSVGVSWQNATTFTKIHVVAEPTKITSIVNLDQTTDTVIGKKNSTQGLYLRAYFDDNTSFEIKTTARGAVGPVWIEQLYFFSFWSESPDCLLVASDGIIAIRDNSPGALPIVIGVASSSNSLVNVSIPLFANLLPTAYDVDMGSETRAPFGVDSEDGGAQFDIAVRLNTNNEILTAFELLIFYDDEVIEVIGVNSGEHWPFSFTGIVGDPNGEVGLIGSDLASTAKGFAVELAVISCRWKNETQQDLSYIAGIVTATTTIGNTLLGIPGRPFIAGAGIVGSANSPDARRLASLRNSSPKVPQQQRLLTASECSDGVLPKGDVNGDCAFNVVDLNTIKMFLLGQEVDFVFYSSQMVEMDPNFDGDVDLIDVNFLLAALAKKYRFLLQDRFPAHLSVDGCVVTFEATFADKFNALLSDAAATRIDLEVASSASLIGLSTKNTVTNLGHAVLPLAGPFDGKFNVSFPLPTRSNQRIEVAMLVTSFTQDGSTDVRRKFPWRSSTYGDFGLNFFSFVPFTSQNVTTCFETTLATTKSAGIATSISSSSYNTSVWPRTTATLSLPHATSQTGTTGTAASNESFSRQLSTVSGEGPTSRVFSTLSSANVSTQPVETALSKSLMLTTPNPESTASSQGQSAQPTSLPAGITVRDGTTVSTSSGSNLMNGSLSTISTTITSSSVFSNASGASLGIVPSFASSSPPPPSSMSQSMSSSSTTFPQSTSTLSTTLAATMSTRTTTVSTRNPMDNSQGQQPIDENEIVVPVVVVVVVAIIIVVIVVVVVVLRRRARKNTKKKINPRTLNTASSASTPAPAAAHGTIALAGKHDRKITGFILLKGLDIQDVERGHVSAALCRALTQASTDGVEAAGTCLASIRQLYLEPDGSIMIKFEVTADGSNDTLVSARHRLVNALNVNSTRGLPLIATWAECLGEESSLNIAQVAVVVDAGIDGQTALLEGRRRRRTPRTRKTASPLRMEAASDVTHAVGAVAMDIEEVNKNIVAVGGEIAIADLRPSDFRVCSEIQTALSTTIKKLAQTRVGIVGGSCTIASTAAAQDGSTLVKYTMGIPGGNKAVATESLTELCASLENEGVAFVAMLEDTLKALTISRLQGRNLLIIHHAHHINGEPFKSGSATRGKTQHQDKIVGEIIVQGIDRSAIENALVQDAIKNSIRKIGSLDLALVPNSSMSLSTSAGKRGRTKIKFEFEEANNSKATAHIKKTLERLQNQKDQLTEALQAHALSATEATYDVLHVLQSLQVKKVRSAASHDTVSHPPNKGETVNGSILVSGIDAKTLRNDERLQETMQVVLADLPEISKKGLNKTTALVTGAQDMNDGSLKVNYRLKLEQPVDDDHRRRIQSNIDSCFTDGGVEFLTSLKAVSLRGDHGARATDAISRLKSIDSAGLEFVTRLEKSGENLAHRRKIAVAGELPDDAVADIGGVLRFRGISKQQFTHDEKIQQALVAALVGAGRAIGMSVSESSFQFVGIRTQADKTLKTTFKLSTNGATARDCQVLISNLRKLLANDGIAFVEQLNSYGKGSKDILDASVVTIADGSGFKCTKSRMRSKLREVSSLARSISGFGGLGSSDGLAPRPKQHLQMVPAGRLHNYEMLDDNVGDGDGAGIISRRTRRKARGRAQRDATARLNDEDEPSTEDKAAALARRRERRRNRLRHKASAAIVADSESLASFVVRKFIHCYPQVVRAFIFLFTRFLLPIGDRTWGLASLSMSLLLSV